MNRIFKFSALVTLIAMLGFTSCEKQEELLIEDFGPTTDTLLFNGRGPQSPGMLRPGDRCFELVFPVTLEFPNGNTLEVEDKEAYFKAVAKWRKSNPRERRAPKIAFPYEIMLKDGTMTTIENMEDLKDVLENCRPMRRPHVKPCYKLVFPVTVKFPDDATQVVNNVEELKALLEAWRTENPTADGRPEIVFPYTVELPNGTQITLESLQDIRELIQACRENRPHVPQCFKIVYPATVVFPDNSTKAVASREEFIRAVREWRRNNPNVEGRPTMQFPFDVKLRDGSTVTVNSKEDLEAIVKACRG